jgi:cytochrome b
MSKLAEFNVVVSAEQAKILAKAIRSGMWEWHIILGYALVFLIFYRLFLYFKDTSLKEPFWGLSLHKKGVKSLYYVIYTTILFMSMSGFIIYFYQDLGLSKTTAHDIKDIHELVFNIIMVFVPLHIAGVVIAENRDEKGIISSMVNGKE